MLVIAPNLYSYISFEQLANCSLLTVVDQVSTSVLKSRGFWVHIRLMYANQTGEILRASS